MGLNAFNFGDEAYEWSFQNFQELSKVENLRFI
jgi:hypothetical protein